MKKFIVIVFVVTLLGAIALAVARKPELPQKASSPHHFQVRGQVRGIEDAKTLRIAHEAIPGYMEAMVMAMEVRAPASLAGVKIGDDVSFELTVTENDSWISRLQVISENVAANAQISESVAQEAQRLQAGETVPSFSFVDQNGKKVRLEDFRGKAVLLTFIYTRCPLPNFCPLMSKNFAALQERLEKEFPGKFHLISASIDPKFDTPQALSEYAKRWTKDETTWSFATGSPEQMQAIQSLFGLTAESAGGLINHDLRTALIDPQGKLAHVWKSNVWTPYEVHRAVREELTGSRDIAARQE